MSLRIIARASKAARFALSGRSYRNVATIGSRTSSKVLPEISSLFKQSVMSKNFSSSSPDIVTYDEIKKLPSRPDVLLIDVREAEELSKTGVVPTAINISLGQVKDKLAADFPEAEFQKLFKRKKPTADTEIIFMCRIGARSKTAMETARQLGYKKAKNYLGSWLEWEEKEGLSK